jgi:hypothetical protein
MDRLAEVEKRRAERRAKKDQERAAQEVKDLEAIDALEEKGDELLHTMTANRYVPGQPVKIAFRAPSAVHYKRYKDLVNKAAQQSNAAERVKAQEQLAECCLVYPEEGDARASMKEAFPGLLISLAIEAAKVAELRSEEEGKG